MISNRLSNHEVLTNVGNVFQEKGQIVVISNNLSSHTVHGHLCAESEKKHLEEPYYHRKNSVKLRLSVLTKRMPENILPEKVDYELPFDLCSLLLHSETN